MKFRNLPSCLSCGQRVRRPNHLRCQSCLDKIRDQTEYVRKSSVERMIRNAMPAAGGAKRISPDNSEDVQADRSILNFNRKIAYTRTLVVIPRRLTIVAPAPLVPPPSELVSPRSR